ncbi:MAG: FemAB-related protein system-associated [Verrucomicrobiaceae bacterium]|nr:FemAB-related protein system-associated [Verrucomicrobiaceae bacterium]
MPNSAKLRFKLIQFPNEDLVRELAARDPENLFITPAFMQGMTLRDFVPCLLGLWDGDKLVQGCLAAYKAGNLSRSLDIRLLPDLPSDSPFWPGLLAACRRLGVWDLSVCAVTQRPDPIPEVGPVTSAESGTEFYLRLGADPPPVPSSSNHRRSIAKALKNGLTLHRTTALSAIPVHAAMMEASIDRRSARGEDIPGHVQEHYYRNMLQAGAGEFFQVQDKEGKVLSSLFFLRSKGAAYYQSAGTSPEGMSLGASPFLIWNAADVLRKEGVTKYCLGGSTLDNTGLVRFKSGFGSMEEPFKTIRFSMVHPLKRKMRTMLKLLTSDPMSLVRGFFFIDKYLVYAADAKTVPTPEARPGLVLERLSNERIIELCIKYPEFHRQAERLAEFPFNDAWGLLAGEELVHVSWMVTAEHDKLCAERAILVEEGEVEITHCFTSDAHRGKGIYAHAIRLLCQQAREMGVTRVMMTTHQTNVASQRGIEKAGLSFVGMVRQIRSPLLSSSILFTLRGHR